MVFSGVVNRELIKQRRRRRQRERQHWQKNIFARALRLFVLFFAVTAQLRREIFLTSRFMEDRNTWQLFSFSFVKLDAVLYNSTPENIANTWQSKRVAIRAMKFEAARIQFSGDVLAAVAIIVA